MPLANPTSSPSPSNPMRFPPLVMVTGIFGVTLLAYLPALRGGLLWDDDYHVTAPVLRSLHGLWQIWFQLGATQQYYPVLHSAFWLEHRLWGDSVLGYHLLNVGLHATAACLFALTLARLRPETAGRNRRFGPEWLAAAVFALHPVCVESVAWISEQKNTLSLVFYLLSALAYLQFDRDRNWPLYLVALGLFMLALLTKSVTAILPAALLLVMVWQRGRLSWRRDILPLLPWFVLGASAGLFTAWVERNYIGARGAAFDLTLLERCFLAGRIVWFYLGKLLWPTNLIFIYPRWQVGTSWSWSLGCLGLAAVFAGLWSLRKWSRAPLVALLFFVGSLFPALGFFNVYPFVFSYVADHWQYLPCLGIIALASEGAGSLALRLLQRLRGLRRIVTGCGLAAATGSVLVVLFALTWRQCGTYRDGNTLYSTTLARNPDCWMAHNNLGLALVEAGSRPEAMAHFREAIRLKPDCADAHNNLGNALAKIPGRTTDAIAEFETALRFDPGMAQAHVNLGWALVNTPGRLAEGIGHLEAALQNHAYDPEFAEAHNDLGFAFAMFPDRLPEAIAEYQAALRLKPDYADAHNNLGMVLARTGRTTEAAAEFERTLQLQPDSVEAHFNLGNVLGQLGRGPEGFTHFRTALRLKPDSVEAHFNLGRALRNTGDDQEAIAEYREALRLAPGYAEIWSSLGSALYRQEKIPEALQAFEEAVRLQPDSALFRSNLGLTLTVAGRLDEAIAQLRTAVQLAPGFADAHYNLGEALQQAGRVEEAAAEFTASGRAQP
jgi:tetratricopeptide (TPR) repeat protein